MQLIDIWLRSKSMGEQVSNQRARARSASRGDSGARRVPRIRRR